jgi:hypothetical protein
LLGSNLDWGQDLGYLAKWYTQHRDARPLSLEYYGPFDSRDVGMDFGHERATTSPVEVPPGYYAVSINVLRGSDSSVGSGLAVHGVDIKVLRKLRDLKPMAMAGYSIYIYRKESDDFH